MARRGSSNGDEGEMASTEQARPTGSPPAPGEGTFTVLRLNPAFRRLWMSTVSTTLGQWMQSTALGWLALDLSNRTSFVGLVAFAAGIPFLLRFDSRRPACSTATTGARS